MSKTLPLIDLVLAHGWVPESMLLQSDHDKIFARLSAQLSKLCYSSLAELDKGFADIIKGYGEFMPFSATDIIQENNSLLSTFDCTYSRTKTASEESHLEFIYELGHSYADKFYSSVVDADTRHCLLWLKEQERSLKSDDDMKQIIRETLNVITCYCRMTHDCSEVNASVFGHILRKLTSLYFEIVYTYLEDHKDWKEYIETLYSEQLPLTFFEFTSIYWEGMPTKEDEEAWNNFEQVERKPVIVKKPVQMVPSGAEAEENEIISKYDHFVKVVKTYRFFECPAVECLTEMQRCKLVRKIVNRGDNYGAYAVAMLCKLEYDKWMKDNFAIDNPYTKRGLTNEVIIKHWEDALSLTNYRAIAGNYNVIRKADSKEDKNKYKSHEYTLMVQQDYENIKTS